MGNSSSTSASPLVPPTPVQNDLPPSHTIEELSDRKFAYLLQLLSTDLLPCGQIEALIRTNSKSVNNLIDRNNNDWNNLLSSVCIASYMDRKMFDCLHTKSVTPHDIAATYSQLAKQFEHGRVNQSDLEKYPVIVSTVQCLTELNNEWIKFNYRLNSFYQDPIKKRDEAYMEFENLAKDSKLPSITVSDSDQNILKKKQEVINTTCAPFNYQVQEESLDNFLNRSIAKVDMKHCMVATLCADKIRQCLTKENGTYFDCIGTPDVQACIQKGKL